MFEYTEEPIEEGVYYYNGNFISQECYILEEVPFLPSINSYIQFSELVSQTDCNTSICKEACPDPQCFTLTNCFEDVSINVQFTPDTVVNNGEVISISLEPGSTVTQELNNYFLCGTISLRGTGDFNIEQASPSTLLYNGRPVYKIVYTVSTTEVTNYIVWSGVQWQLWKNFDFNTGPSCDDCECNEPYLILVYPTSPQTSADLSAPLTGQIDPVSGTSSVFALTECHTEIGIPNQFRILQYCPGTVTTVLPDNNCWKVEPYIVSETICLQLESEAFGLQNLNITPTSYDSEGKPVYTYSFTVDVDVYTGTIYWNVDRWENYINGDLIGYISNPDKPVSTNTIYEWAITSELAELSISTTLGLCDCELTIVKDVQTYTEVTEDNIDTLFDVYGFLLNDSGLTQSDMLGNYFSTNLISNIPGSPQGLSILNAVGTATYFWEILNQSYGYSNVSIVDPTAFPVELIQTGTIVAPYAFIRIKLTVTDEQGCTDEIIFFTGAFN
jgi:hypothetical protein